MWWVLVLAGLGTGPVLDPLEGETVTAEDRRLLPSGRHLGWVADQLLVNVVSMQVGGSGLALFDRLYLSAHGRAWSQLHLMLNRLDITDPARPGSGLVAIPSPLWDRVTHNSLWSERPGFSYAIEPRSKPGVLTAQGGWGRGLGGGTWIPRRVFDREPASAHGSPRTRRSLADARTLFCHGAGQGESSAWRIAAEYVAHQHRYALTLNAPDRAERATIFAATSSELFGAPYELVALYQRQDRSHEGATYRLPAQLTGQERAQGFVAQVRTHTTLAGWKAQAGLGIGYREDEFTRHDRDPIVSDIEGEWLWLHRPRHSELLRRLRSDILLEAEKVFHGHGLVFTLRGGLAYLTSRPQIPQPADAQTYLRGAGDEQSVSISLLETLEQAKEYLASARLGLAWKKRWQIVSLQATAALDWSGVGVPGTLLLDNLAPAVGIAARIPFGEAELFALVRREPEALTAQVAAFLDPKRPSGRRYRWEDDGDRIPRKGETGALLGRFGGKYHEAGSRLARPASHHFSIGYLTPSFGPLRGVLTGSGRWHVGRYSVRFDPQTQDTFTRIPSAEPATAWGTAWDDARKHYPAWVYARDLSQAGNERFVLVNAKRPDFWLGAELQLLNSESTWWFVNLATSGYWNIGRAPFGAFPDRNDPGVISEAEADPNLRLNGYGRYDQDRSFGINLLAGFHLFACLTASTALRYRDGQPFTGVTAVEGLPQGPTPVAVYPRGYVRHTFHMSMDVHLAYEHHFTSPPGLAATLALDLFNLFGSGTEIVEDPRFGENYRRPLEMVPGRTLFATLELAWQE